MPAAPPKKSTSKPHPAPPTRQAAATRMATKIMLSPNPDDVMALLQLDLPIDWTHQATDAKTLVELAFELLNPPHVFEAWWEVYAKTIGSSWDHGPTNHEHKKTLPLWLWGLKRHRNTWVKQQLEQQPGTKAQWDALTTHPGMLKIIMGKKEPDFNAWKEVGVSEKAITYWQAHRQKNMWQLAATWDDFKTNQPTQTPTLPEAWGWLEKTLNGLRASNAKHQESWRVKAFLSLPIDLKTWPQDMWERLCKPPMTSAMLWLLPRGCAASKEITKEERKRWNDLEKHWQDALIKADPKISIPWLWNETHACLQEYTYATTNAGSANKPFVGFWLKRLVSIQDQLLKHRPATWLDIKLALLMDYMATPQPSPSSRVRQMLSSQSTLPNTWDEFNALVQSDLTSNNLPPLPPHVSDTLWPMSMFAALLKAFAQDPQRQQTWVTSIPLDKKKIDKPKTITSQEREWARQVLHDNFGAKNTLSGPIAAQLFWQTVFFLDITNQPYWFDKAAKNSAWQEILPNWDPAMKSVMEKTIARRPKAKSTPVLQKMLLLNETIQHVGSNLQDNKRRPKM